VAPEEGLRFVYDEFSGPQRLFGNSKDFKTKKGYVDYTLKQITSNQSQNTFTS
jgi:hypothetical protein